MSNQPEMTIDNLRISIEFGGMPPKQGDVYEFPLTEPVLAALSAMVAEIIGEDEVFNVAYALEDHNKPVRNNLRLIQRQRAAKLGFTLNKEDK